MREHVITNEQRLPMPPATSFEFFADATNLEQITPPWLSFRVVTPEPIAMRAGALIDYRLRIRGVPLRWRTLIEEWDPGTRFVDRQLRGPYALWHHIHEFTPDGNGGTVMRDTVRYRVPFGPVGTLADRLFVRRDLERIFAFRRAAIERNFIK